MSHKRESQVKKPVHISGIKPLHFLHRTAEDMVLGAEAWVSLDGKTALPARVVGRDDRHYDVEFERASARFGVRRGCQYSFFRDEVRSTPQLACMNMVTM